MRADDDMDAAKGVLVALLITVVMLALLLWSLT